MPTQPDGKYYAQYRRFYLSDVADNYRLHVEGFHGTASDSALAAHNNGLPFTTFDNDNDSRLWSGGICAVAFNSGWWFDTCSNNNPNGLIKDSGDGVKASHSRDLPLRNPVQKIEMKVRQFN